MGNLTLPIKGEYFDQIRNGEKTEEYRLRTPHWAARIEGKNFDNVVLTRGYPKGGGVEGETRLTRKWLGFRKMVISHPHFGDGTFAVFAIDVSMPSTNKDNNHG